MAATLRYDDVEVGTELPPLTVTVQRINLVMYAGASGDFNVIHWNQRFATMVGLPDVIAHGMYTMAQAGRVLTNWAGDPAAVVEFGVRFSRPVVVADDDTGATLVLGGTVTAKGPDRRVSVELTARCGEQAVLAAARAVVALS